MPPERVQFVGLGLLVSVPLAALAIATLAANPIAFLRQDEAAPWIGSPDPVSTGTVAATYDALHVVEFRREVDVDPEAGPLRLRVDALRGFELEWNGRLLEERPWRDDWRGSRLVEIADDLRPGGNALRVRVRNPDGPPLLRLRGEGAGVRFATDAGWEASRNGAAPRPARVADDTLRAAAALTVPPLGRALAARATLLVALLLASGLLAEWLGRSFRVRGIGADALVWLPIAALWIGLFATAIQLPAYVGFDGPDHLDHVHLVQDEWRIPLADEGPQTYQPPLFYWLSAALLTLAPFAPERLVLRVLPFACGLAQIAAAVWLARLLFPGDRLRARACAVAAGFLPLHLYMAAYLNNQPLFGALGALALVATVRLLVAAPASLTASAGLGAWIGLAVLAKVSGLVLVPLAAVFLTLRHAVADRARLAAALLPAASVVAASLAVCGWFFLRNQRHFGQALIGNWDVPGSPVAWWQHPGFHTPAYYLRFGEVLYRPFFASFDSFWDGLYSAFWGDGLIGGIASWAQRHPLWDYEWMAVGYALALPASALLLFGFGALVRESLRGEDWARRIALSFVISCGFLAVFVTLFLTLVLPAYSMTKASYLLWAAPVFALALAEGWSRAHAGLARPFRVLLHAWTGAFLATVALAFVL